MELRVIVPDSEPPTTLVEVVGALRAAKLKPTLQSKDWGDWIVFAAETLVVSIESNRGLTTSATIEYDQSSAEFQQRVGKVFAEMGWQGEDENGPYPLYF